MTPEQHALLRRARDQLPPRLNAGILMGDGGFCILGWMLLQAGFHQITLYGNTLAVTSPQQSGHAVDVVARVYGLERAAVRELAELNDRTPSAERVAAVRRRLDRILAEV
jgi:hypothetical protein